MKKIVTLLLIALMSASTYAVDKLYLYADGTSATLKYGDAWHGHPYWYYYMDDPSWGFMTWSDNVSTYKTQITSITIDASCQNFTGNTFNLNNFSALETVTGMENLNTANFTDISIFFSGCQSLKSVDLSGVNTANVTDMTSMFAGCSSLTSLDLSTLNTANVTKFVSMFQNCTSLKELDLSGWDTGKAYSVLSMFNNCSNLEHIYVGDKWDMTQVTYSLSSNMFEGCVKLPNYDNVYTSASKAHVGEGGYLSVKPDYEGEGTEESPYLITDAAGWNTLATRVAEGNTYSGKYFQLTTDIAIETMVGLSDHAFNGTFDGDGHTITATLSNNDDCCAPFAYTYGATIKNLHVTGTITTTGAHAGGVVGRNGTASLTLINVSSDMTINATNSNGGLVGYTINATISGCAFTGKLLSETSRRFGGLVGWKSNTDGSYLTITDCVFDPEEVTNGNSDSKAFAVYGGGTVTITNCYYSQAISTDQGKQARSITAGEGVLVLNTGSATIYNVSGITSYGTGIRYDNVLYGGNGDEISLNLSGSENGYEASTGTLSGTENPYTLTMADADCQINKLAPAPTPAGEVTVVFAANDKTVERTVTLPHTFKCDWAAGIDRPDELDIIIHELYNDYYYCNSNMNASGSDQVEVGTEENPQNDYITIKGVFEGTATVTGDYFDWITGEEGEHNYSITISIKAGTATAVENVQTNQVQATKILRDGMLLIEKNGKLFNVTGALVR